MQSLEYRVVGHPWSVEERRERLHVDVIEVEQIDLVAARGLEEARAQASRIQRSIFVVLVLRQWRSLYINRHHLRPAHLVGKARRLLVGLDKREWHLVVERGYHDLRSGDGFRCVGGLRLPPASGARCFWSIVATANSMPLSHQSRMPTPLRNASPMSLPRSLGTMSRVAWGKSSGYRCRRRPPPHRSRWR